MSSAWFSVTQLESPTSPIPVTVLPGMAYSGWLCLSPDQCLWPGEEQGRCFDWPRSRACSEPHPSYVQGQARRSNLGVIFWRGVRDTPQQKEQALHLFVPYFAFFQATYIPRQPRQQWKPWKAGWPTSTTRKRRRPGPRWRNNLLEKTTASQPQVTGLGERGRKRLLIWGCLGAGAGRCF